MQIVVRTDKHSTALDRVRNKNLRKPELEIEMIVKVYDSHSPGAKFYLLVVPGSLSMGGIDQAIQCNEAAKK